MKCGPVRDLLASGIPSSTGDLEGHLQRCAPCREFASRIDRVRRGLKEHRTLLEPHPSFAERVVASLPSDASLALGWAAARILPLGLLLLVILTWVTLSASSDSIASEPAAPTDDLVGWVLESTPEEP